MPAKTMVVNEVRLRALVKRVLKESHSNRCAFDKSFGKRTCDCPYGVAKQIDILDLKNVVPSITENFID